MPARLAVRHIVAALALTAAFDAAQAGTSVRYDGNVRLHYESYPFQPHPGRMNGNFDYSAIFYYDDGGEQVAATLIVADVVRSHYTHCDVAIFPCAPLAITPTSLFSSVATTPEDGIQAGVFSPGQFGGMDLLGARLRIYDLVPGDSSNAFVAWSLFDDDTGFGWNSGDGTVARLTLAVPEPASWAMLIAGFGLTGAAMRRRRLTAA